MPQEATVETAQISKRRRRDVWKVSEKRLKHHNIFRHFEDFWEVRAARESLVLHRFWDADEIRPVCSIIDRLQIYQSRLPHRSRFLQHRISRDAEYAEASLTRDKYGLCQFLLEDQVPLELVHDAVLLRFLRFGRYTQSWTRKLLGHAIFLDVAQTSLKCF